MPLYSILYSNNYITNMQRRRIKILNSIICEKVKSADRKRALFLKRRQQCRSAELLMRQMEEAVRGKQNFTLPRCLVCSLKQSRKPLSNKATTIKGNGFTGNMVVIWKDATTATTISVTHSQLMVNSMIC